MTATTTRFRLGPADQVPPGEGRSFSVAGDPVAVFRLRTGQWRAVSAVCPHAGGPLADGQIDGEVVICPLHANVFELATGCSRTGQPALRSYPVWDEDGELVIDTASR